MSKRSIKKTGIILGVSILFLLAVYIGLAEYYKEGFSYGTWVNGIYCTGKSVEEINRELTDTCTYEGLTVYDKEGLSYDIKAEEIDYRFDFEEALQDYLDRQNPYGWIANLFTARRQTLLPVISYDKDKLKAILEAMPVFTKEAGRQERRVFIIKTYNGYELINERTDVLNVEKAEEEIENGLLHFEACLDLKERGCYENLPYTEKMQAELVKWEKIKDFQDCHIVYSFGDEQVFVDASVVCDWIAVTEDGSFAYDENGNLQPDDKKIEEFVDKLADEYDTVGGSRHFQTTRGDLITIEGGIYGNRLDRKAEKAYLKQAFREKAEEIHTPAYLQKGWAQGKEDIGKTYIEVDMTEQMMYYYKNGNLELETPVVTGNTGRRMGTPEGVNYVYGKQKNRILRGPNYASHVNFWMPVKGNIGIHDAAWRSEFGGEIYKTGGSHGCINTPYDAMSRLYEMAEVGTPVVMFY